MCGVGAKFLAHLMKFHLLQCEVVKVKFLMNSNITLTVLNLHQKTDPKVQQDFQGLQKLRENKVKGQMVRAHLQWLDQGEKPTSFFCKLETKNYVDKTIKRIQTPDGSIITEQSKILQKVQEFYSKLFDNKDNSLKSMATSKIPELQYFKKN